jgi:membrane-bound metal-dependent hydrolase YbcI (DUF457 family)
MLKTHLAMTGLVVLLFLPHISSWYVFVPIALLATILPDIDTGFSTVGKTTGGRVLQFFVRHRGVFHSLTFAIVLSFLFAVFIPILALPFFLGYSLHLFVDSFTIEGIKPFWPLKHQSSWKIKTGGITETSLFVVFLIIDLLAFMFLVKGIV